MTEEWRLDKQILAIVDQLRREGFPTTDKDVVTRMGRVYPPATILREIETLIIIGDLVRVAGMLSIVPVPTDGHFII